jgi:hypothetical protein
MWCVAFPPSDQAEGKPSGYGTSLMSGLVVNYSASTHFPCCKYGEGLLTERTSMRQIVYKAIALFGVIAALVLPSTAEAGTAWKTYPNSVTGPYYMECTAHVQSPSPNSAWAYNGLFAYCSVPHRSYHYWWGSSKNTSLTKPDVYQGTASLGVWYYSYNGHASIDYYSFYSWQPQLYGSSRSTYLPPFTEYVTVPGGWCETECGTSMTSATFPYTQSINTWGNSPFFCCEGGEGCQW